MRTFVAICLPQVAVAALHRVPRPPLAGIRWTTPAQWHVTVAFLGELGPDQVALATSALRTLGAPGADAGAPAPGAPPQAVLGPATEVLHRQVLCVPVEGLDHLAGQAAAALRAAGFDLERRPFRGHVTLARARGRTRVPAALAGAAVGGRFEVHELVVMESTLGGQGSRYRAVARVPVAGAGG